MTPVVLADGTFDPLHHGHVAYLHEAARLGILIVNVAPDSVVEQKHPVFLLEARRAAVIAGLHAVHSVRIGPLANAIHVIKPDFLVKGEEWRDRLPLDVVTACREVKAEIRYLDTRMASSSALLADYQRRADGRAVAALERFIQTQPPQQPWVPTTDYSLEARRGIEGPHAQLIKDVFEPSGVLDYGCGLGHLVTMLRELGLKAFGYEPHVTTDHYFVLDDNWFNDAHVTPLVVCREVFEHVPLSEWEKLIRSLVAHSSRYIYLTTRFHPNPAHLLDVTTDGHREIDPTEITFATKDLLRALFVLHGCKSRPDLEAKMDWKGLGRVLVFEV